MPPRSTCGIRSEARAEPGRVHVTVWNICALSVQQRLVPDHQRGRQNSLFKLSGLIGLTLGAAVAGPIVDSAALAAPFGIAALIFGICTVYTGWLSSNHSELADGAGWQAMPVRSTSAPKPFFHLARSCLNKQPSQSPIAYRGSACHGLTN